jgi:hypothetical protein
MLCLIKPHQEATSHEGVLEDPVLLAASLEGVL